MSQNMRIGHILQDKEVIDIADQLTDPSNWIERRVESLSFLDDSTTRRRISFDYLVQPEFLMLGYIPLAVFKKENLSTLDVRSGNGHAISVLTKHDATDLAIRLLKSGLKGIPDDDTDKLIREIVDFKPDTMDKKLRVKKERELYLRYGVLLAQANFRPYLTLAQVLLRTFILWVQLPENSKAYQRLITKVAYEESLPFEGMMPPRPLQTVVHPNWASRFHFEVIAPAELKISELTIRSVKESRKPLRRGKSKKRNPDDESTRSYVAHAQIFGGSVQVGHVAMDGYPSLPPAQVDIVIVPSPGGTAKISFMVAWATMYVFAVPSLFKFAGSDFIKTPKDGTAAALLLLGPALLVAYLARSPEHPIVAHRMRGARYSLLLSGGLLMLAAGLLGGIVDESWLRRIWYLLTLVAIFGVFLLRRWGRASKFPLRTIRILLLSMKRR